MVARGAPQGGACRRCLSISGRRSIPVESQTMAVRILIVDDHPLVREGLIGLLGAQSDFEVCGEASGLAEAREALATVQPDVVIVDLTLRDGHGIELIKEIKSRGEARRVLVLSMHDETMFAERALRAGAVGYVSKHEAPRTIVQAVR